MRERLRHNKGGRTGAFLPLWLLAALLAVSACSSIDCPLNNTVSMQLAMAGDVDTLKDTLTIAAIRSDGTDTVVYNRGVNVTALSLPVSYAQTEDVLLFAATDTLLETLCDTIRIAKTNQPHFESVDCSPVFFHTITGISYTRNYIDSVVINNANIDYDATKQHLYIYYRTRH